MEDGLALLDPLLTIARLRGVLERLYGYWSAGESALAEWARREPASAQALRLSRRMRTPLLSADLELLGAAPSEIACAPLPLRGTNTSDALGWLYVTEGSTLGGAVLRRRLRVVDAGGAEVADALRTFLPYAEGPGPMWRAYVDVLENWVGGDAARQAAVVSAAEHSFTRLERWALPADATKEAGAVELTA